MPPIRIPVKPRPPVPPGSAVWPPKPVPPDPGPITPPGPRGDPPPKVDPPDTIRPGGQPTPPNPEPPMPPRQPGMYSDAFVALNQTGGSITADIAIRDRWTEHNEITFAEIGAGDGANLHAFVNNILRPFYDPGNATAIRPWMSTPPGSAVQKSASKERLMADEKPTFEQEMLAALAELRHGLAVLGDQIAALTARFDAPVTPEPPAQPADDDAEFWAQFFAAPDPDPETFSPEMFTTYSRGRVLYQWRANYTPLAKRVYRDVTGEMFLIRAMYDDPEGQTSMMFRTAGVEWETAVYAILSGRVDDLFAGGLASRPQAQIFALTGKTAEQLFLADIAGDKQGGTPSGNEG